RRILRGRQHGVVGPHERRPQRVGVEVAALRRSSVGDLLAVSRDRFRRRRARAVLEKGQTGRYERSGEPHQSAHEPGAEKTDTPREEGVPAADPTHASTVRGTAHSTLGWRREPPRFATTRKAPGSAGGLRSGSAHAQLYEPGVKSSVEKLSKST